MHECSECNFGLLGVQFIPHNNNYSFLNVNDFSDYSEIVLLSTLLVEIASMLLVEIVCC